MVVLDNGLVLLAQPDEAGLQQLIVVDRRQLRALAADVERAYRAHDRAQRLLAETPR